MRKAIIIIFCILGMVVGLAVGEALSSVSYLSWLNFGGEIGISTPVVLDLAFLQFTIGFWIKVTVAGVIGMVSFGLLSRVVVDWLRL